MDASRFDSIFFGHPIKHFLESSYLYLEVMVLREGVNEVGEREGNYNAICYRTQVTSIPILKLNFHMLVILLRMIVWMQHVSVVFSATPGGVLDRAIDAEEKQHKDFLRLVCSCLLALYQVD